MNIEEKEGIEIDFWKNSETENPTTFTNQNFLNKMSEAKIFYHLFLRYKLYFNNANSILEIGGGQGWASCLVKKEQNSSSVQLSDISHYAIESLIYWEKIFNVKLENKFACKSYEIPLPDKSVDLVYCFAAAHHFVEQKKTLKEIKRVLKPNGVCLYLYEPTCRKFIYPLAFKRVNSKRPEVPEDLLIVKEILRFGRELGLKSSYDYFYSTESRGPIATVYYLILSKFKFLAHVLPCTANFIFIKE